MFTAAACERRADECVRLANLTEDEIVRAEILQLRQTHLANAQRLKELERGGAAQAFSPPKPAAKQAQKLRLGLKVDQR